MNNHLGYRISPDPVPSSPIPLGEAVEIDWAVWEESVAESVRNLEPPVPINE